MNTRDPELREALVQRYVLGTMGFRARRRFNQVMEEDASLRDRVLAWEERLAPMALSLPPVQPGELVWARIAREIRPRPSVGDGRGRAVATAAMLALLALTVAITSLGWWRSSTQPPQTVVLETPEAAIVSVLADADGSYWVARIYSKSARLDIDAQAALEIRSDKDYELWTLQDDGTPVSLGLLPQRGKRSLQLDAPLLAAISRSNMLAVSLEPPGGSPQAVPTGPVLYSGQLFRPQT